jgi:amidohydrolase
MRRMIHIVLPVLVVIVSARQALAQSTDFERQAAAHVLLRIDSLERRLDPAGTAQRLANRKDAARDKALARAAEVWDSRMQSLSDWIGHHPEVGWHEFQAVDTLTAVLRSMGFTVSMGTGGLQTAFTATWTSPAGANGPTLGLIGEYDALRGTQGDFHGDQHNAQSPVAMAAAQAIMDHMAAQNVPGRVIIYGTPAEEVDPPAKFILWQRGAFRGADILVRSHSTVSTSRDRAGFGVCCLNIDAVKYTFTGRPAHQLASWNGRNALEAAVQFYSAVDHLRSTWRPEHRVQGVIPEGGVAPNVVPDHTVVDYFIRYPDEVYLEHIARMMDDAAHGAAKMTETEVEITRYGEYRDGITTGTLQELAFAYAKKLGAPGIVEEARSPSGYEETGMVSREIPGIGVRVKSSNFPNHTYGMRDDTFLDVGHTGFRFDAQLETAVLFDFLTQPEFRAKVVQEQQALAGLQGEYLSALRAAYGPEIGADTTLSLTSRVEIEIPVVKRPQ